jgi:hypothetical protein
MSVVLEHLFSLALFSLCYVDEEFNFLVTLAFSSTFLPHPFRLLRGKLG